MAVLSGISGMQMGDGAGGNIALTISTKTLRILSDMSLSYLAATIKNPNDVKFGTVSYYRPEIIKTDAYGTGVSVFDAPQVALKQVNLSTRRTGKWTYEEFDLARLGGVESVIGMIANGLALGIQADLNAHFISFLVTQLATTLKAQNIVIPLFGAADPATTPEQCRVAMNQMKIKVGQLSKLYDANKLGVKYSEIISLLSVESDIMIENAFWGQQGSIDIILNGLKTKKFGNVRYIIENMLHNKIDANTSFSKDKALDTMNFNGIILHNEAVAMPMNFLTGKFITDPITGNPKYIMKYQFGIDILRPELVWGVVNTVITRKDDNSGKNKNKGEDNTNILSE